MNKTQTQILEESMPKALNIFKKYSPNTTIIKKEKVSKDIYFVLFDFPKASSLLVNNNPIDATRGVLFFAQENRMIILSKQFLSNRDDYKNYEKIKKTLLDLKQNNFKFVSHVTKETIINPKTQGYVAGKYLQEGDFSRARYWLEQSALQGDANSQWNLALMLIKGDGVEVDLKSAKSWLEKSSNQGYIRATYDLGAMYNNGEGMLRDTSKAKELFLKCAQNDYKPAIVELVKLYREDGNKQEIDFWSKKL